MDFEDNGTFQNTANGNARADRAPSGEESADTYEVGYKKPPKETRWKKGCKSPNPSGRPKRQETVQDILNEELERRITSVEGGKKRKISLRRGLVRRVIKDAIEGNAAARKLVLAHDQPRSREAILPQEVEEVDEFTLILEEDDPWLCPSCRRANGRTDPGAS